jgi:hypothetical protein
MIWIFLIFMPSKWWKKHTCIQIYIYRCVCKCLFPSHPVATFGSDADRCSFAHVHMTTGTCSVSGWPLLKQDVAVEPVGTDQPATASWPPLAKGPPPRSVRPSPRPPVRVPAKFPALPTRPLHQPRAVRPRFGAPAPPTPLPRQADLPTNKVILAKQRPPMPAPLPTQERLDASSSAMEGDSNNDGRTGVPPCPPGGGSSASGMVGSTYNLLDFAARVWADYEYMFDSREQFLAAIRLPAQPARSRSRSPKPTPEP